MCCATMIQRTSSGVNTLKQRKSLSRAAMQAALGRGRWTCRRPSATTTGARDTYEPRLGEAYELPLGGAAHKAAEASPVGRWRAGVHRWSAADKDPRAASRCRAGSDATVLERRGPVTPQGGRCSARRLLRPESRRVPRVRRRHGHAQSPDASAFDGRHDNGGNAMRAEVPSFGTGNCRR